MNEKIYIWNIDKSNDVSYNEIPFKSFSCHETPTFKESKSTSRDLSTISLLLPLTGNKSTPLIDIEYMDLMNTLINSKSTNGIYLVPGLAKEYEAKNVTLIFSTRTFLKKYWKDIHIDTTTADPRYFFKGRSISSKLFMSKLLQRVLEPSRFNNVDPGHKTYDDILLEEFEKLSVSEIKEILRKNSYPLTGSKKDLIRRLTILTTSSL